MKIHSSFFKNFGADNNPSRLLWNFAYNSRKNLDIVPSILQHLPKQVVNITYPSGVEVRLGNELTPTKVTFPPSLTWNGFENMWYCVTMIDADAPRFADARLKEMVHWMIVNIPGTDITKGETIAPYVPCAPLKGTGLHRYVFAIYRQPGKVNFLETRLSSGSFDNREGFSSKSFSEMYKLGQPIAYNWFVARWDRNVPKILRKVKHSLF